MFSTNSNAEVDGKGLDTYISKYCKTLFFYNLAMETSKAHGSYHIRTRRREPSHVAGYIQGPNTNILQTMVSGIPLLSWAIEPERKVIMFMWSLGLLVKARRLHFQIYRAYSLSFGAAVVAICYVSHREDVW